MEHIAYPFEEFSRHFDDIHELLHAENPEPDWMRSVMVVRGYMQPRYQGEEFHFKVARFVLIVQHLCEHITDFDQGDFAVNGSNRVGALVSEHLLKAVHHYYTSRDFSEMGQGPATDEILAIAETFRDK